jgi:hypothetical protein
MKLFDPTMQVIEHIWRQFAPKGNNLMICMAECHFHTIEACVSIKRSQKIGDLEFFLLKAINISKDKTPVGLNNLLHLGSQIIRQIAVAPIANGLIQENADDSFEITELGFDAIQSGKISVYHHRRCHFHFISGSKEFVRINDPRKKYLRDLTPKQTGANWNFDPDILRGCIGGTDSWKIERGFPMDVAELVTSQDKDLQSRAATDDNSDVKENDRLAQKAETLIVDKAQGTGCTLVIKFLGDNPCELRAYPFISKSFLESGEENVLFSLSGAESILKVLPDIDIVPSKEQLGLAWRELGEDYGLENISRATIKAGKTSMVVTLDSALTAEWLRFCWQVVKGEVFCCIDFENMIRLNKISLKAADEEADKQLDAINLLYEIKQTQQTENVLRDVSGFQQWLSSMELSSDPDIYELASLAWRTGEFGLAYRLAELEDMADAKV